MPSCSTYGHEHMGLEQKPKPRATSLRQTSGDQFQEQVNKCSELQRMGAQNAPMRSFARHETESSKWMTEKSGWESTAGLVIEQSKTADLHLKLQRAPP